MLTADNPMNLFNSSAPPDQVAALRELFVLLGGLGHQVPQMPKQPQPQQNSLEPILGGLSKDSSPYA